MAYKSVGKLQKLPISTFKDAVVSDPQQVGFQPRNLMPLREEVVESYRHAGGWDPTKPLNYVELKNDKNETVKVIVDGNTRYRLAAAAGYEEVYAVKVELEGEGSVVELLRARAHSNVFTKSDPWTQAETLHSEFVQDITQEEIAKMHGISVTTVRKHLRLYELVKNLGPKPKAEETPEQLEQRLAKAKEAQEKVIAGIRSGEIAAVDLERIFAKEMDNDQFDKAVKAAVRAKKAKAETAAAEEKAATLEEYTRLGVPTRFLPDLKAQVSTRATGLTDDQIDACEALIDVIIGTLPREQFLKGDFTPPVDEKESKKGEANGAAEAQSDA